VGLTAALTPLPSTSKTNFTLRRLAYLLTIYSNVAARSSKPIQSIGVFIQPGTPILIQNHHIDFTSHLQKSQSSLLQNTFQHFPKISQVWRTDERSMRSTNNIEVALSLLHKVLPLPNIISKPFLHTPSFHNT
jgi:hypothetical protein